MKTVRPILAATGAVALLLTAGMSSAFAGSSVTGHVYVNNNTAGHNSVSGFYRHADGTLTPIPGTPFEAGGAGLGTPTGSAGALQESADGRYLLAVDAAANEVAVLKIRPDGTLRLEDSVASNGRTPLSIAVHGSLVYVANAGAGDSNYTGFRLNAGGHLRAIPGSTYDLPDAAMPGQVLFSPDGSHLIGTRVGPPNGPSFIDSFAVGENGTLIAAPGSPFPAQRIGPFGSQFLPTDSSRLYVSNAHDGTGNGSVSAYDVAGDGALTPISGSPYPDLQTAPCWVAITHDSHELFAVNTGTPSISSFAIGSNGQLNLQASTPFSGSGLKPFDAGIDPGDQYLYVTDSGAAKVSAFAISGGTLTELASSPVVIPGGGAPFGIVVD
jgi:DNA-binding beta-propeller fold protein YncE